MYLKGTIQEISSIITLSFHSTFQVLRELFLRRFFADRFITNSCVIKFKLKKYFLIYLDKIAWFVI